jgi:NAD(P)-dependent dehydrogenase (short-subunit alcohol dehydrogenase family)
MAPNLSIFSLSGMNIVVAGASRGIGFCISEGLAKAGAKVYGFGRSTDIQSDLFEYHNCDVSNKAQVSCLLDNIEQSIGIIHAYFHVAGITLPASGAGMQTSEDFSETLTCNLTSAYICCLDVAGRMIKNRQGSIITVTSIGSILAFPKNPGYVSAKGGLRMMSKALALDLGPSNVRVNSILPGYISTDMTAASYMDPVKHQERASRTMLGRWGEPSDLVGAAIFLASEASGYITGADLVVDGGWTAKGL